MVYFFSVSNNDSTRSFILAPSALRSARLFIARRLRCACVTHSRLSTCSRCQGIYNASTASRAPWYPARLPPYILGPSIHLATARNGVDTVVGGGFEMRGPRTAECVSEQTNPVVTRTLSAYRPSQVEFNDG